MPDQALTNHNDSPESPLPEDPVDDKKQGKTADHPQGRKRSVRRKAVPDVVMLDAVLSDSEQGEEEEGSDAEFEARPKGSKKVRGVLIRELTCACTG